MKALLKKAALSAKGKKGFTLVEVIVVLVILAILMAIAIPALTGYIEKARQQSVITEARSAQTALQTIGTEVVSHRGITFNEKTEYTGETVLTSVEPFNGNYAPISTGESPTILDEVKALAVASLAEAELSDITFTANGQLNTFTFANETYEVTYTLDSGGYGAVGPVTSEG